MNEVIDTWHDLITYSLTNNVVHCCMLCWSSQVNCRKGFFVLYIFFSKSGDCTTFIVLFVALYYFTMDTVILCFAYHICYWVWNYMIYKLRGPTNVMPHKNVLIPISHVRNLRLKANTTYCSEMNGCKIILHFYCYGTWSKQWNNLWCQCTAFHISHLVFSDKSIHTICAGITESRCLCRWIKSKDKVKSWSFV